jgi:hypothetical protein
LKLSRRGTQLETQTKLPLENCRAKKRICMNVVYMVVPIVLYPGIECHEGNAVTAADRGVAPTQNVDRAVKAKAKSARTSSLDKRSMLAMGLDAACYRHDGTDVLKPEVDVQQMALLRPLFP